jgi:zinc/manganese transport system permease protein
MAGTGWPGLLADALPLPTPSWDVVADLREMWSYPFMVNAFRAGTIAAVLAGAIGWYMVARRQSFVGHTLALVGFPGAAGAVLVGVSATYGYLAFCLGAALVIGALPRGTGDLAREESAVTGTVQAFALACGLAFVAWYGGFLSGVEALLFGSFLGITDQQVLVLLAVAVAVLVVLAAVGRPLLLATVDESVAAARGVPVRLLSFVFLLLLGATAAEASQITGTLLVFALLVVPAAAGQALTTSPWVSAVVTVAIALAVTWAALFVAYYSPYPLGFWLTSIAFVVYLGATAWRARRERPVRRLAVARGARAMS